jgi:hypothetical protein
MRNVCPHFAFFPTKPSAAFIFFEQCGQERRASRGPRLSVIAETVSAITHMDHRRYCAGREESPQTKPSRESARERSSNAKPPIAAKVRTTHLANTGPVPFSGLL